MISPANLEPSPEEREKFNQLFCDYLRDHPGPLLEVVLMPDSAFIVMAALQLALRHPGYQEHGIVQHVVESLARRIADAFPGPIRDYAHRGFNRKFDIPSAAPAQPEPVPTGDATAAEAGG